LSNTKPTKLIKKLINTAGMKIFSQEKVHILQSKPLLPSLQFRYW